MSDLDAFRNLPEINFIDNTTLEQIKGEMIKDYQDMYQELTGETKILYPADPYRILINAVALQLFQGLEYINRAGKDNLLRYASGLFLDHLGSLKNVIRLEASPSQATIRFTSSGYNEVISIPKGTRVTAGDNIFFATDVYVEIPKNKDYVEVSATCLQSGIDGNKYEVGQLNVLADPIAYIDSVSNTSKAVGCADVESDDSLRERIFLAPSSYSVAGPIDAYIFWTKSYKSSISDVYVYSPTPGDVEIYIILQDGVLPNKAFLENLSDFLANKKIRPLTDNVTVNAASVIYFEINLTYYISDNNISHVAQIRDNVTNAVENYINWQKSRIGRDINSSELIKRIVEAGAKRVDMITPIFTKIDKNEVAICINSIINYGGLESD